MELLHKPGEIIAQRYRILNTLGQGGVGTTYEAQDLQNSQSVALKALSLRRMADWKVLELFEREARILSGLNHPAIPRYLDYFQVDTPQDRSFYIAQQLATGKSLAVLVESGWQPDEAQVRHLATQILEILVYLQELTPPVIHRDIKPPNIILCSSSQSPASDTQVFLVDFGAVQDTYRHTVAGGSTVVGTYGYMAPEQFRGQAVLSTDLYGLGTTLLFFLTRKSPVDLPQRKLRINFRSHVSVSEAFADWLEKMIEPASEDRFPSASAALAVLRGERALTSYKPHKPRQRSVRQITLTKVEERLVVEIPPVLLSKPECQRLALLHLSSTLGLSLVVWYYFVNQPSLFFFFLSSPIGVFFFILWISLLAFTLRITSISLLDMASRTRLEIEQDSFCLQRWLLGWCYQKVQGRRLDINGVKLLSIKGSLATVCELRLKRRKYHFGSYYLTQRENERLVGEITAFLEKM